MSERANDWVEKEGIQAQLDKLVKRIAALERKIEALDYRTVGSIRLGPNNDI